MSSLPDSECEEMASGANEGRQLPTEARNRGSRASLDRSDGKGVASEKERCGMFAVKPRVRRMGLLPRTERPFGWMPEEFSTLFHRLLPPLPMFEETAEWPYGWGLTTEEKEKEILVRLELPGFELEEVKVEVLAERLMVEAEHKEEPPKKGEEEVERTYAHVKREITLPPGVVPENVTALYRNGILEIHVPRKPEAVARRIEVKT